MRRAATPRQAASRPHPAASAWAGLIAAPRPRLQSPFGEAKPRETVIAARVGKTEEEVLLEEVKKDKLHVSTVH